MSPDDEFVWSGDDVEILGKAGRYPSVEATGRADSFVIGFLQFPCKTVSSTIEFESVLELDSNADGSDFFLSEPIPVRKSDNYLGPGLFLLSIQNDESKIVMSNDKQYANVDGISGWLIVATASVNWKFQLDYSITEPNCEGHWNFLDGIDVVYYHRTITNSNPSEPSTLNEFQVTSNGWTHVQFDENVPSAGEVRAYSVTYGNGFQFGDFTISQGEGAWGGPTGRYAGTMTNSPGPVEIHFATTDSADVEQIVSAAHLPFDKWPESPGVARIGYCDSAIDCRNFPTEI